MVPFMHLNPTIFVLLAGVQHKQIWERNLCTIEVQIPVMKILEQRERGQRGEEDVEILVAVSAAAIQSRTQQAQMCQRVTVLDDKHSKSSTELLHPDKLRVESAGSGGPGAKICQASGVLSCA
jgi:hypothetical protein